MRAEGGAGGDTVLRERTGEKGEECEKKCQFAGQLRKIRGFLRRGDMRTLTAMKKPVKSDVKGSYIDSKRFKNMVAIR